MIFVKRVYDRVESKDGTRFLVDNLWPRGLNKEAVKVKSWVKAVSPSDQLRKWFGHDPARWREFQRRYFAELNKKSEMWQPLVEAAREGDVTLIYSARDTEHNNAVALRTYLLKRMKTKAGGEGQ